MHLKVNYAEVASRYDRNPVRHDIPADLEIARLPALSPRILDLACGTGTYLAAQSRYYPDSTLAWHGADASTAMLDVARTKAPRAKLTEGRAEALPYANALFDYVVTRFAFHHFTDKTAALAEVRRVLKPRGSFKIVNIAPDLSPRWWLYRYFPAAAQLDERRFWSVRAQMEALTRLGFEVEPILHPTGRIKASLILGEAANRETSELVLLDDAAYAAGLAAMRRDLAPDETIDSGLTLIELTAR